ncbi:glycosyltransferase family 9 protein [bacterium]
MELKNKDLSFIVFRTDRLGDLVLSIPTAELIKKKYPDSLLTFVVQSYTAPVLKNNPFIDDIIYVDKYKFLDLLKIIKKRHINVSIILFSTFKSTIVSLLAKIPLRIGPMSKWWSIFLNRRIKQKRSRCEKNEAVYNIELLNAVGIGDTLYPKLYIDDNEEKDIQGYYKRINPENKKLVIIHPGSGHSSKNWR